MILSDGPDRLVPMQANERESMTYEERIHPSDVDPSPREDVDDMDAIRVGRNADVDTEPCWPRQSRGPQ